MPPWCDGSHEEETGVEIDDCSRLFLLGLTGLLDDLGEVLTLIFASLERSILSFHGLVESMAAENTTIELGSIRRESTLFFVPNNIEISKKRRIVTELGVELSTYPRRGIKSKRGSIVIISSRGIPFLVSDVKSFQGPNTNVVV
ncbi:hypothetical protein F2Q70_00016287 [Brassica cretica]|uniref:Uncharacterized protein n=1 Tax=Brassica cretica TaxID=69181 RepID=A0A8S9HYD1_BRACR|nr:hypothetical protein F2Q70_00016287 [Brassica cretica]